MTWQTSPSGGHEVIAYVRDAPALRARDGLTVVTGQLRNEAALCAVLADADVVVCAIGPRFPLSAARRRWPSHRTRSNADLPRRLRCRPRSSQREANSPCPMSASSHCGRAGRTRSPGGTRSPKPPVTSSAPARKRPRLYDVMNRGSAPWWPPRWAPTGCATGPGCTLSRGPKTGEAVEGPGLLVLRCADCNSETSQRRAFDPCRQAATLSCGLVLIRRGLADISGRARTGAGLPVPPTRPSPGCASRLRSPTRTHNPALSGYRRRAPAGREQAGAAASQDG